MFNQTAPTRSEGTKRDYVDRYGWLKQRFCREANVDDLDPNEVVANLILAKPNYSMRGWRQVKSATLYYIEAFAPQYEHAAERLRQESSSGLRKSMGKKRKEVPTKTWRAIQAELESRQANGYRNAGQLLHVLRATMVTGLRPNEWAFSEITTHEDTGRDVLRVRNSKHTNGRANGEFREMFIDELLPEERSEVETALRLCATNDDADSKRMIHALRDEFAEVRKTPRLVRADPDLVKSSVTLYSFRHQFIANAKMTYEEPEIVSALCGHVSTKTAFEHYGARRNARNRIRVSPTPESVAAVANVKLETYRDFVAAKKYGPTLS